MRKFRLLAAGIAWALLVMARAEALVVTYDLNSDQGPIELTFEADDMTADNAIVWDRRQADISSILDITLDFGGTEYTLIGAIDSDVGLLDRWNRTISYVVADSVRPWANTLTAVELTFGSRMRRFGTVGDLFAYLAGSTVVGGNLTIDEAEVVPLPGAALFFLTGVGLAARRLR